MSKSLLSPACLLGLLPLLAGCGAEYRGPLTLTPLWSGTAAPSVAALVGQLNDQNDLAVDALTAAEFAASEDGDDAVAVLHTAQELDVVQPVYLMLDMSHGIEDEVLDATLSLAHTIVDAVGPGQSIQLYTFADALTRRQVLTSDREAVHAAIDALEGPDGVPTDLYGAMEEALDDWDDQLSPQAGMVRGLLVVVTDGGDGPVAVTSDDVIEARGDRAVLTIGLGKGADAGALEAVANQGTFTFSREPLEALDEDWAGHIARVADSTFRVGICSAGRGGAHTLGVDFRRDSLRGSWEGSFDAAGFDVTVPWGVVSELPEPIGTHAAREEGGFLYVAGGDWDGNVFYAPILPDHRLGNWREGEAMPQGSETRFEAAEGHLYAINGPNAWVSELAPDGAPGPWQEMTSPGYANVMRSHEGVLYSFSRQQAWSASIAGGGAVGEWTASEELPVGLDGYVGAVIADGRAYVVGAVSEGDRFDTLGYSAPLAADGSIGAWEPLPPFGRYMGYWLTADTDGEHLLVLPGDDGDGDEVLVLADGTWQVAGTFGQSRRYYSTAVVDGHLYLHGGYRGGETIRAGAYTGVDADGLLGLSCTP